MGGLVMIDVLSHLSPHIQSSMKFNFIVKDHFKQTKEDVEILQQLSNISEINICWYTLDLGRSQCGVDHILDK